MERGAEWRQREVSPGERRLESNDNVRYLYERHCLAGTILVPVPPGMWSIPRSRYHDNN